MAWGRGVELLLPSPERIESDCPLYGKCGGRQFRHTGADVQMADQSPARPLVIGGGGVGPHPGLKGRQGERWRVRLEKVNKNVAWGRGVELLLPSPARMPERPPAAG